MNSILNTKYKYERIVYIVYIVIEDSLLFEQYIARLEQTKLLYTKCIQCTPLIHLYCMCVFAAVLNGDMYEVYPNKNETEAINVVFVKRNK